MKTLFLAIALWGCALAGSGPALAENDYSVCGVDNSALVVPFIASLQKAVAAGDKAAVAAMVSYPIVLTVDGQEVEVADTDGFLKLYDKVITQFVKDGIARQGLGDEDIFFNQNGIMVAPEGQIWIMQEGAALRIYAINSIE